MPQDIDVVTNILEPYYEDVLDNARREKANYIKYINSLDLDPNSSDCVVDLGYSGTAQFYLSKMLNKKVEGAYFLVGSNLKPIKNNNKVYSCFNKVGVEEDNHLNHPIGLYSLFLESFLTANKGQLKKFDDNGNPIYLTNENDIENQKAIYEIVKEYIDDLCNLFAEKDILDINIDLKEIEKLYDTLVHKCIFETNILKDTSIEDLYCSNTNELNVIDKYGLKISNKYTNKE